MPTVDTPGHSNSSIISALHTAFDVEPNRVAGLNNRLAQQAARSGLLDVAFRYLDSPFGELLVAATDAGVVRVAFQCEGHAGVLAQLARHVSPRIIESTLRTEVAARQLGEYFEGQRHAFDVTVDLRLVSGFRRHVVTHLSDISYGTTASYAQLAAIAGNPRAVRAVGSACAHNPVPVIVPCHRVVHSDGTIGNYLGGIDVKRSLLEMESA